MGVNVRLQTFLTLAFLAAPRVLAGAAAPWDTGARGIFGWFNSPTVIFVAAIAFCIAAYGYFGNDNGTLKKVGGIGMVGSAIPLSFSVAQSFVGATSAVIV